MKKYIIAAFSFLFLASSSFSAPVQGDSDSNGALDVSKGGTNSTSAANARTALGLGLTDNVSFGNVTAAGGTLTVGVGGTTQGSLVLKSNTDPIYTFGIMPAASPSAIVAIKAPPAMPTADNSLWNVDINGVGGWTDPATFATPTGSAADMTVVASGFDGNLATTDNTLQEIAQKLDDLTVTGSAADDTAYNITTWDANADAPTKNVIRDYMENFDADGDGSFTDEAWFPAGSGDDQTAAEVNITDAGNYFTGTTVEAALQEIGALPTLAFGTGLSTSTVDNTTTVSVTANTYQAYDADIADLADGSLTGSKVAGYAAATASKATTYTIGTDSADESYGGTIYVTSATTITAPAVVAGMNFSVVTIGDIAVSLDVDAADKMILDGVTLADGDKATNSSKAGDTITCQYYSADGWYCWSGTVLGGHWTDGN